MSGCSNRAVDSHVRSRAEESIVPGCDVVTYVAQFAHAVCKAVTNEYVLGNTITFTQLYLENVKT